MMEERYAFNRDVTKELLDSVQVSDLVKCNDWKVSIRVKGVSENYFVMARKAFGKTQYSICEKKPWPGIRHNEMTGGMFHIGPDNLIFGWFGGYDFDDEANVKDYLQALEKGEIAISQRRGCPITRIVIKRGRC